MTKLKTRWLALIALAVVVAAAAAYLSLKAPARPNVIVVLWDCVRADHISGLGFPKPTSPTLDRLGREGLSLTRTRSQAPWTLPAVSSLLTGRHVWNHGAGLSAPDGRNLDRQSGQIRLPGKDVPYLSDWLSQQGWQTLAVSGNIYIGPQFFDGRPIELTTTEAKAGELTDLALTKLQAAVDRGGPVFAYLHYMDAHFPTWPPEKYRTMFLEPGQEAPTKKQAGWDFPNPPADRAQAAARDRFRQAKEALFAGAIRYLDDQLARLADWAADNNAIIVVAADHGEEFWDHQDLEKKIYRDPRKISGIGHGHTLFDELIRVPLVIWGPGLTPKKSDYPAGLIDVWPTLAGLLGLAPPAGLDGVDLIRAQGPRPQLSGGTGYGAAKLAVVDWPWKCILSYDESALLFNLESDPGERTDLTTGQADRIGRLVKMLDPALKADPSAGSPTLKIDEGVKRRLKSLGYM